MFTRGTMHMKTALKGRNLHFAEVTEAWNALKIRTRSLAAGDSVIKVKHYCIDESLQFVI